VIGQLNVWAATIATQIADLGAGLASANGRAILLAQEVEVKNAETQDNLRQVMAAGSSALTATIDGFRVELGKHEHAHNLARSQIEAVVISAERKFQENHDIACRDAQVLYDGFAAECARRDAEDAALRKELQNKFAQVEGMLDPTATGRRAAPPAATDPLQQDDSWAQARAAQQGTAAGGAPPPTGAGPPPYVRAPPGMAGVSGATAPSRYYVVYRDGATTSAWTS
jgi:hypothetical protein